MYTAVIAYEDTVKTATRLRAQLFEVPALWAFLVQVPAAERQAALRHLAQHLAGLDGLAERIEAAAMAVLDTWQTTRTAEQ